MVQVACIRSSVHFDEISHKVCLHETKQGFRWKKRPRCTARIARIYRRKERLKDSEIWAAKSTFDRRGRIFQCVSDALGTLRPCPRIKSPLFCDRYLCDAVYRWLLDTAQSPDSWTTYALTMRDWVSFGLKRTLHRQVDTVSRDIQDYLYQLEAERMAPRTIALRRDVLRSWFSWLLELGVMERTPINRDIKRSWRVSPELLSIQNGKRNALDEQEANAVAKWAFEVAKPVTGLSVLLQESAGLRSVEVARAERKHLTNQGGVWSLIVLGKGRSVRVVVLEQVVVDAWLRYAQSRRSQGNRGPLLVRPGGGHYSRRRIQQWAKAAATSIQRQSEISSHGLRRTSATRLIERGAQLDQVAGHLGHKNIMQTTRCYVVRRKPMEVTTGIVRPAPNGASDA